MSTSEVNKTFDERSSEPKGALLVQLEGATKAIPLCKEQDLKRSNFIDL